ncbi:hypothetical protein J2Z35_002022 [Acetoanaerobium pronyense]|uniref:NlpC/P60 domain-containing protein n=1 Tax=Acetoanaerobium pronyense TaxID=1482736 RepID=A0ABS4KLX2_9FIRM|nr:NlpC/P60 family protein [Acetoanaerobium pronyense]MBP2028221.1 hypothetical protein [Acetoanaerobium pronyense]
MAKKFTSRDKVVNKMTKDGLEELNVTKGTKENISNRIKDISLERKKDKFDLKTDNIKKNAKNKRQKRQQKIVKNQSVDSYSKINNPGYEQGSIAESRDKSIKDSKVNINTINSASSSNNSLNKTTSKSSSSKSNKANIEDFSYKTISSLSKKSSIKYSDKKDYINIESDSKSNKTKFRGSRNADELRFSNRKNQTNESRFKLKTEHSKSENSSRLSNKAISNKYRNSNKSTDDLVYKNTKSQGKESRFKLKSVSDKKKIHNKTVRLSTSSIRSLEHIQSKVSLKHNRLKSRQRDALRDKFEDTLDSDDNSLQSDTFKTVSSSNKKLQKGIRYIDNKKISKENIKYKEEIERHKKLKQNSKLKFEEQNNAKKPVKFLIGAGSHTAKFSKDSLADSVEREENLQADTSKFLREGTSIISSKINSIRKFSNFAKKGKTQKDINKRKSALNQKNKELIQHDKKRNLTKLSTEEKKKIQKNMYKKQYFKAFKSNEMQKTSETIQINQNRFIAMIKSSKAAMVRVVTALSSLLSLPFVISLLLAFIFVILISITSLGGAVIASIIYQSSDVEITKTNGYFSELEVDLAIDVLDTEINHPGYDEYEYSLDNIGHDPHMIASYLSVKFSDGFKLEDSKVKSEIEDLFKRMYTLERKSKTETRGSGEDTYTVTILRTTLKTKPLEDVIDSKFGLLGIKEKISYKMLYESKGSFTFMKNPVVDDWKLDVIKKFGYSLDPDTGQKTFYPAMDIQPMDSKVFALVDGIVHYGSDGFGEYLEIRTFAGNRVRYSNVSNFLFEEGERVLAGEEISSISEPSLDSNIVSFLRLQLIDQFDNFLDPYFYLPSYTDTLSDAYIFDFSQNNNYNSNPNFNFPEVEFENYDDWVKALLEEAQKHLGKRYVFGSNGPNTFDCSSFVTWTFTHSGVKNMPRTTAQGIYNSTQRISKEELRPGDIVFFTGTYNAGRPVTHVGIYVGNKTMIHAGDPVQYANLNSNYWQKHYYGAGRVFP